jgi:tripartite-type tricarboxylate transporter receptor subunit TctC
LKFTKHPAPASRRFGLRMLSALGLMGGLGLGLMASNSAMAQAYPNKPIRLVVTFPTGGAPDILARLFSEKAQLGQPVVIDNKPGAGGNIGSDIVAKSPGDGHTIVMGTVGTHSINGALYEKMPYDMVKNFTPISLIASAPNLLVVNNDLPVKTVPELIAYMKANPNKLSYASPGIGTSVHMSGELFKSMTGTSMTHVPYKGRQFYVPDLLGGSVQLVFDNMPSALPLAKEGKIRAIAQTTAKRSPLRPMCPPWLSHCQALKPSPGLPCLHQPTHPSLSLTD